MADQSSCPLHRGRLTGGLYYAPNSMGNYSMYSPPCNGCTFGLEEALMFGRLSVLSTAFIKAQETPTPDLLKAAWEAVENCLVAGIQEETSGTYYYACGLYKIVRPDSDVPKVVLDFASAGNYAAAAQHLRQLC